MLHITENPEHLIKGEAGLISAGGLTSRPPGPTEGWRARTFTAAVTAQTGVAALENPRSSSTG